MKGWKFGLEMINNLFMIAGGFLFLLILLKRLEGIEYWYEPDMGILSFELGLSCLILLSGVISEIIDIKEGNQPWIEHLGNILVMGEGIILITCFSIFYFNAPLYTGGLAMLVGLVSGIAITLLVGFLRLFDDALK